METSVKYYSFGYGNVRTYLFATAFIVGNLLLPQLCHLISFGGMIWLPIYFFTLIGAYKYGWRVGALTAVLSPLLNYWLFGMPGAAVLPVIIAKSLLLVVGAAWAAQRYRKVSVGLLLAVVLFYQTTGTLVEWLLVKDLAVAVQDFRMGLPGMVFQVIGGYFVLKFLSKV